MERLEQNKMHMLKEKFLTARDFIMDHSKIVMPLVLIVCVLITVVVAVNANQREALEKEAEQAAMAVTAEETGPSVKGLEAPVFELEENAHPEINQLIRAYYDAQVSGDTEVISSLNTGLSELEMIRIEELSKYIDSYPELTVYTKPGMTENTYVAYVYSEVLFTDAGQALPGMQTYYIGLNDEGSYYIQGTYDDTIKKYIEEVTLQDDVVDLNNKVVVAYNELLAEDEELNEFIAYLKAKINEEVGEILAQIEAPADTQTGEEQEASGEEAAEESAPLLITTVRATDVVNIRSSDSEEADRIDKAQVGQEFTLLEQRGNGWSKVAYNGSEAYIKSDYLEAVPDAEETGDAQTAETTDTQTAEAAQPEEAPAVQESMGTVKVVESVKVRKGASTSAESLGTAYAGEELELLMKQADGWTKVKYKGETAFVKSEYVE